MDFRGRFLRHQLGIVTVTRGCNTFWHGSEDLLVFCFIQQTGIKTTDLHKCAPPHPNPSCGSPALDGTPISAADRNPKAGGPACSPPALEVGAFGHRNTQPKLTGTTKHRNKLLLLRVRQTQNACVEKSKRQDIPPDRRQFYPRCHLEKCMALCQRRPRKACHKGKEGSEAKAGSALAVARTKRIPLIKKLARK